MATADIIMTAEEFAQLPDNDRPAELVRGRIVPMNMPYPRHGQICGQVVYLLRRQFEGQPKGHVIPNDSGVVTERDPDTVRGPDIAFYSYDLVPAGPFPQGYLGVVPEAVFEVRSPSDNWTKILAKVAEFLEAGVRAVCVLDQMSETARVFCPNQPEQLFTADQELILPEPLADFRVLVRRFFE